MVGRQLREAVLAALAPLGVNQVAIGGLSDDYIQYVTTPAEYSWQSYEGGSTLFGPNEATFVQERLVELAADIADGKPAPSPYNLDPSYGVHADGPVYPAGASSGTITSQPARSYPRLGQAQLAWDGGPSGHDRPLDKPFVLAQHRQRGKWTTVDTDLGLNMLWRVDDSGHYTVEWEVPLSAAPGMYRLVVTATRYTLSSAPFTVAHFSGLDVVRAPAVPGYVAVTLTYPPADPINDLTSRPQAATGGTVTFLVNGRPVTVRRRSSGTFAVQVPAGAAITVPPQAAHDAWGNTNANGVSLQ
jgi:neutral ceramidase